MEMQKMRLARGFRLLPIIEILNGIALCEMKDEDEDEDEESYYQLIHKASGLSIPGDYYSIDCAKGCLKEISQLEIPNDGVSITEEVKTQAMRIIDNWRQKEASWSAMTSEGRCLFNEINLKTPISIQRVSTGFSWTYSSENFTENSEVFDTPELALFSWIQWACKELDKQEV